MWYNKCMEDIDLGHLSKEQLYEFADQYGFHPKEKGNVLAGNAWNSLARASKKYLRGTTVISELDGNNYLMIDVNSLNRIIDNGYLSTVEDLGKKSVKLFSSYVDSRKKLMNC